MVRITMNAPDEWTESNGGPLLLLPCELLPAWGGLNDTAFAVALGSDYARACAVDDYVGGLAAGDGWGLVLGDEPLPTRWLARPFGGIFARWIHGEDDESVASVLMALPDDLPWQPKAKFVVHSSPLMRFDAAEPGAEPLGARSLVALRTGTYAVSLTAFTPDEATSLLFLRLDAEVA